MSGLCYASSKLSHPCIVREVPQFGIQRRSGAAGGLLRTVYRMHILPRCADVSLEIIRGRKSTPSTASRPRQRFPTCNRASMRVRPIPRIQSSSATAGESWSRCDGASCPIGGARQIKELRLATFNARVETVTTKPFFREPFKKKRCLMPVSGYYEWEDTAGGKQPHYFTARDGSPILTIAGLWDEWKNRETGERLKSCAMIICEPNEFVAKVHDRMPVSAQAGSIRPLAER